MNWYYIDGPKRVGPFTETEWDDLLRRGAIRPETRVWNEELSGWVAWSEVPKEQFALPGGDFPQMGSAGLPVSSSPSQALSHDYSKAGLGDESDGSEDIFVRHARRRLEASSQGQGQGQGEDGASEPFALEFDPVALKQVEHDALSRDYNVAFLPIFRGAIAFIRENLFQVGSGTFLIYALIVVASAIPGVSMVMSMALTGVLMGGLFFLYIRRWRGESTSTMEAFNGFEQGYFKNLALKTALSNIIVLAFLLPGIAATRIIGLDLESFKSEADIAAALLALDPMALLMLVFLFGSGILVGLYFNICWLFALPLIRDKGLPYRFAMRLSRLRVLQHPWRVVWTLFLSATVLLLPCFVLMVFGALMGDEGSTFFSFLSFLLLLVCLPVMTAVVIGIYREAFGSLVVSRKVVEPGEEKENGVDA